MLKDIPLGSLDSASSAEKLVLLRSPRSGTKMIDLSLHLTVAGSESSTLVPDDGMEISPGAEEIYHTAIIPVLPPFDCDSTVSYRHSVKTPVSTGGSALISTIITAPGARPIHVESLAIRARVRSACSRRVYADMVIGRASGSVPVELPHSSWGDLPHQLDLPTLRSIVGANPPSAFDQNTSFAVLSEFAVSAGAGSSTGDLRAGPPAEFVFRWRR